MATPDEPPTRQTTPTSNDPLQDELEKALKQIRFDPSRGWAIVAPNIRALIRNPQTEEREI